MELLPLLLLLAAGALAGFLAGFFGVGGGFILVPILLFFYQSTGVTSLVSTHLAFGTSLFIIVFASASSAFQYARSGQVIWKAVLFLGVGSVAGGAGGAILAGALEGHVLRRFFAVLLFVVAVQLLSSTRKQKNEAVPALFPPALSFAGVIVGIVSALAGVGGGVVSIPMMHLIFRFPFKKALGTSSATIVITALAAGTGYAIRGWGNLLLPPNTLGYIDYINAIPLIVGSIPLAMVGAKTAQKVQAKRLATVFAVLIIILAFRMFFL